jgi:hypothetical protein
MIPDPNGNCSITAGLALVHDAAGQNAMRTNDQA